MRFTAITPESNSHTLGQLSYADGSTFNVRLRNQTDGTKRLSVQQLPSMQMLFASTITVTPVEGIPILMYHSTTATTAR